MAGALSGLSDFITTLAGFAQDADLEHHDNIGLRVMRESKCVEIYSLGMGMGRGPLLSSQLP
jgi:hypothetical protein